MTFAAVFAVVMLISPRCFALFGLFGGGIPVIEPLSISSEIGKTISVTATEIVAMYDKLKQEIANTSTAAKFQYLGKFDRKVEDTAMPGTKRFKKLVLDEDKVKKQVHKLFMQYPSEDIIIQTKYKNEAQEFYDDTVLDVFSGVNELNKYLTVDIAAKFAELKKNYDEGGHGAEKAEDMNAAAFNSYIAAHQTMDSIALVIQEATALKAQLTTAKAMRDSVEPLVYPNQITCPGVADADKLSYNLPLRGFGRIGNAENLSFAQVDLWDEDKEENYDAGIEFEDEDLSNAETVDMNKCIKIEKYIEQTGAEENSVLMTPIPEVEEDETLAEEEIDPEQEPKKPSVMVDDSEKFDYQRDSYNEDTSMYKKDKYKPHEETGLITFERGDDPKLIHSLYEKRKYTNEFDKLEDIYTNVKNGIDSHNLIKKIREAEESFKDYDRIVKLHERAKKALAITDHCGSNLMSYIYSDPGKVWCGAADCEGIDDTGIRSGISGWALETYETAKAANISSVDEEKLVLPEPLEGLNAKDLNSVKTEEEDIKSKLDILSGDEYSDLGRKAELLPWQIGAAGIKSISKGGWGSKIDNYRVWNDSRAFYTQFTAPKYDNFYVYVRAETADYIIREGMKGWNIANMNNAIKEAKEQAEQEEKSAREEYAEAVKKGKKYDLAGALKSIKKVLNDKMNDIKKEKAINDKFIPSFKPKTDIKKRGDIVDESSCAAAIAAGEAAKSHLKYRTNPLGALYLQGKGVYSTADAYLYARIMQALNDFCTRGEPLFLGQKSAAGVHGSLVGDLIAYYIDIRDNYGVVVYKVKPYTDFLNSKDLTQEREQYFVGSAPQERDLKAPKEPAKMTYSPLREIFHYDNIDMDNSGAPSKKAFLNHGGEIPEIWKVLLQETNPFVEYKFNLKGILNGKYINPLVAAIEGKDVNPFYEGYRGSTKFIEHPDIAAAKIPDKIKTLFSNYPNELHKPTLVRGGLHPCLAVDMDSKNIDNNNYSYFTAQPKIGIDLQDDKKGYVFEKTLVLNRGVNPCIGITQKKGDFYHEKAGAEINAFDAIVNMKESIDSVAGRSELGVFLKSDDSNNISWRPNLQRVYDVVRSIADNGDTGNKLKDNYYKNVPFINNQIGAFLIAKDVEQQYRKAREAMEKDIAQLAKDIQENMERLGLTTENDLNLADEKSKNEATSALGAYKDARIKDILRLSKRTRIYILLHADGRLCIPLPPDADCSCRLNKPAKVRVEKYLKIRAALIQDKDELTTMSESSLPGPELAEEIKMEEANLKVRKKYLQEAEDAFNKQMQELTSPYCANYHEGAYTKGCGG